MKEKKLFPFPSLLSRYNYNTISKSYFPWVCGLSIFPAESKLNEKKTFHWKFVFSPAIMTEECTGTYSCLNCGDVQYICVLGNACAWLLLFLFVFLRLYVLHAAQYKHTIIAPCRRTMCVSTTRAHHNRVCDFVLQTHDTSLIRVSCVHNNRLCIVGFRHRFSGQEESKAPKRKHTLWTKMQAKWEKIFYALHIQLLAALSTENQEFSIVPGGIVG